MSNWIAKTGIVAAVTSASASHPDEIRPLASEAWSAAVVWCAGHETAAWCCVTAVLSANVVWWLICLLLRRRHGEDIFAGELATPSITSSLFTLLVIALGAAGTIHLATHTSPWAVVTDTAIGYYIYRAVVGARHRWRHTLGIC
jgi:uncharacterized membrane protein YgdD (TMEM256/DUF423 family)